jgi:type II secretory pathway component GspD/PulD (secretin)
VTHGGRRHWNLGYPLGLAMVGLMPTMMGVVLSCTSLAQGADASAAPGVASTTVTVDALVAQAHAARQSGNLVTARDLLVTALQRDPANAAARSALAVVDSEMVGAPTRLDGDPVGGDVRKQAALAEARMQASRAELLAASNRFEDAIVLLSQSRVALLPYAENEAVRSEAERIDGMLTAYRERHLVAQDHDTRDQRTAARQAAEQRSRHALRSDAVLLDERIARIDELAGKGFIESALAACRKLVDTHPDNQRVERLYTGLIARSHTQRELSIVEQRDELLQETQERLERSLIPSGFDGWPSFPDDWNQRHTLRGNLDAPLALEPWEQAINEKLAIRLSFNLVEQNAVEVLSALAKQAGINLIVDPSVFANGDVVVTLKANDITFRNALSWICRLADTKWYVDRGAVYIGGQQESRPTLAIYDVSELLFVPKDQAGKNLAFAGAAAGTGGGAGAGAGGGFNLFAGAKEEDAAPAITPEDLVDLIQQAVTPAIWQNEAYGITIRGTTLMVTAPKSTHLLIQEFIRSQANQKSQLVRVTARWLTVKDGYMEEIGVDWRSDRFTNAGPLIANPTSPTPLQIPNQQPHASLTADGTGFHRMTNQFDSSGTLINNLPAAASTPSTSAIANSGLNLQAMLINQTMASTLISAVERNTKGTILEAPEVVTMSGVRANTFMGRQYAYIGDYESAPPAGSLDGTLDPDIGVLNLGAVLDIKPYVSADGKYVTMEFRPAIASLESIFFETITVQRFIPLGFDPNAGNGNGNGVITGQIVTNNFGLELPNVLVREVSTQIMVPDGGTILVGGFGKVIEQTMSTKIPFLGHIPFLGRLFGKRGRYSDRYQLYLLADIQIINYAELEAKL